MKKTALQILLICLLLAISCYAQPEAHRLVKERMKDNNIPGMAFLIAKDGKIIDEGYYGKANIEVDADVHQHSLFAIASMTKTYTAAAILLMAEKGLLKLKDPVTKYIPEAPESWKAITIYQLLTHTSGLIEDWALGDMKFSNELFLKTQTDEAFLKLHFEEPLLFPPGTNTHYSSGPFVLGIVIQRITGRHYSNYLKKNIFEPLGLAHTFVDHPYHIMPGRVSGYYWYDSTTTDIGLTGIGNGIAIAPVAQGRGDAGIRACANDLFRFYHALLSDEFLSESSKKLMFEPAVLNNGDLVSTGAGWMNWPQSGFAVSEHSGAFRTGFSSQALIIPKEKLVVVLLTNMRGGANFSLAQALASLHYPALQLLSDKKPVADTQPALTKEHLQFFQQLNTLQESINVHPNFPKAFYSDNLKKAFAATTDLVFLGERNVAKEDMSFFGVRIYRLRQYQLKGKQTRYTTVYLDKENRIVCMDYPETQ